MWFARRHAWHLVPKLAGAVSLPFIAMSVLGSLPTMLAGAVTGTGKPEPKAVVSAVPVSPVAVNPQAAKEKNELLQKLAEAEKKLEKVETAHSVDTEIVMLFPDGILLRNGKKHMIEETFRIDGKEETLECVNVRCGIVKFSSGKTIRF